MTVPVWPVGLPQRLDGDGFTYAPRDQKTVVTTANGGERTGLSQSSAPVDISGSFVLTDAEYELLLYFHDQTLAHGVRDFDFPSHINGGADWRCKFAAPPAANGEVGPGLLNVSVALMRLP